MNLDDKNNEELRYWLDMNELKTFVIEEQVKHLEFMCFEILPEPDCSLEDWFGNQLDRLHLEASMIKEEAAAIERRIRSRGESVR